MWNVSVLLCRCTRLVNVQITSEILLLCPFPVAHSHDIPLEAVNLGPTAHKTCFVSSRLLLNYSAYFIDSECGCSYSHFESFTKAFHNIIKCINSHREPFSENRHERVF